MKKKQNMVRLVALLLVVLMVLGVVVSGLMAALA